MGGLSAYVIGGWFDILGSGDWYATVFYADPLASDPLTVEVLGPSYSRPLMNKERVAFNLWRNTELLAFTNLPPGTHIFAVGAMDAPTNGNLLAADNLLAPVSLDSGGSWVLDPGQFQVGIDAALGP